MIRLKYCNKNIILKPYTVRQEQNVLALFDPSADYLDMDLLLKTLGVPDNIIDNCVSEKEKIYIYYMLRAYSVEGVIDINMLCPHCGEKFKFNVDLTNLLEEGDLDPSLCNDVISDNLQDFFDENIDDLEPDDYDQLEEYINKHKTKVNLIKNINCFQCNSQRTLDLSAPKILLSSVSNMDMISVFKADGFLIRQGKFNHNDILDNMTPAVRNTHMLILNEEIKEHNEREKKKAEADGLKIDELFK